MAVGALLAWGSTLFNLNFGGLSLSRARRLHSPPSGFCVPLPAFGHVFAGFEYLGILLITAIPFGIYDLVEATNNVESAAAAGDSFPTTRVLTADGVISMIGCLMGNPFILAVYIGHPGWKAMGGRIGHSVATGVMVIVLCWLGIVPGHPGADPRRRDPADPALHRLAHRLAGLPGDAAAARAGRHPRAGAQRRRLGAGPDQAGTLNAAAGIFSGRTRRCRRSWPARKRAAPRARRSLAGAPCSRA